MVVQGQKGVKGEGAPRKGRVYKEIDPLPKAMLLFLTATLPTTLEGQFTSATAHARFP